MPGGRPPKYHNDIPKMFLEYFNREPYTLKEIEVTDKDGNTSFREIKEPCDFPTIAGFAVSVGVSKDTIYEWGYKYKELSDVLKMAKSYQERILSTNVALGLYNTTWCIFMAKNLIDWNDKRQIEGSINHEHHHTVRGLSGTHEFIGRSLPARSGSALPKLVQDEPILSSAVRVQPEGLSTPVAVPEVQRGPAES